MIITNLTPEQLEDLQAELKVMAESNPHLGWNIMYKGDGLRMEDKDSLTTGDQEGIKLRLDLIEKKIDQLDAKLELIFGPYVLVGGRWVKIEPTKQLPRG